MPGLAVGTKLAGVAVTWGAVWIGCRLFTSTWVTRAPAMWPRPKCSWFTTTTDLWTLTFL